MQKNFSQNMKVRVLSLALAAGMVVQGGAAIVPVFAAEAPFGSPVISEHMNNKADVKINLSLEDLITPFPDDLYYGRKLLTSEGQKAWDLALKVLLEYDNSDGALPRDKQNNTILTLNYAEAGIYPTADDCNKIQSYLVRNEPRVFHLKDWPAKFSQADGVVSEQIFYIGNGVQNGSDYHNALLRTEDKVSDILSVIEDDMTIYQQIWAVQKAYESNVRYDNAGSCSDIRGPFNQGNGICGGYSKGWMYLMQRMGIEAIWADGWSAGYHAWNYLKVNGEWYMADVTWGGKNWWLNGADYTSRLTAHDHYNTFATMPELAPTSIPHAWADYPSIWLDAKDTILVDVDDHDILDDLELTYGNIYGEDLEVYLDGDFELGQPGEYTVEVTVSDDHGNSATDTADMVVADIQTENLTGSDDVELLFDGEETWYNGGFRFHENGTGMKKFDLPESDNRVFEAKVGVLGSVRDNTSYGHYANVSFKVEFLDADGNVIDSYETGNFGWKTPAELISLKIPAGAVSVQFGQTAKGDGNNHGGFGDVKVVYYDVTDPAVDAEVAMLQKLFKTVSLKANGVYPNCEEWITLDQKLNAGRSIHIKNPTYGALMRRLAAMEESGIKDAVLKDRRVKGAMQEFLAYADWMSETYPS